MRNTPHFLDRLTELMEEFDLNIFNLSKKMVCDDKTIARWFKNKYYPRHYLLIRLANYFKCSIDYLLGISNVEDFIPSKHNETFHIRLRNCMEKEHYTVYRVAKLCKISPAAIGIWFNFGKMPETATLISLAFCFSCSVDYLLGRTD